MTKTFLPFLFLFLFTSPETRALQNQAILILKGVVISSTTAEPVSFATIALDNSSLNTLTNEKGQFKFRIPAENKNQRLKITHVGYKPVSLVVKEDSLYIIRLGEQATELNEVVVKKINALELLKKAIAKVPENYSIPAYRLGGFYRMTGQKEKKIIDLSEAVYNVYYENFSIKNSQSPGLI
jgi:CarboxypepD_reg-like domain